VFIAAMEVVRWFVVVRYGGNSGGASGMICSNMVDDGGQR